MIFEPGEWFRRGLSGVWNITRVGSRFSPSNMFQKQRTLFKSWTVSDTLLRKTLQLSAKFTPSSIWSHSQHLMRDFSTSSCLPHWNSYHRLNSAALWETNQISHRPDSFTAPCPMAIVSNCLQLTLLEISSSLALSRATICSGLFCMMEMFYPPWPTQTIS